MKNYKLPYLFIILCIVLLGIYFRTDWSKVSLFAVESGVNQIFVPLANKPTPKQGIEVRDWSVFLDPLPPPGTLVRFNSYRYQAANILVAPGVRDWTGGMCGEDTCEQEFTSNALRLEEAGLDVVYVFQSAGFYMSPTGCYVPPEHYVDYLGYLITFLRRHPYIDKIEIANEPDAAPQDFTVKYPIYQFMGCWGEWHAKEYGEFLRFIYSGLNQVDLGRHITISSGGVISPSLPFNRLFLAECARYPHKPCFDWYAFHHYTAWNGNPNWTFDPTTYVHSQIDRAFIELELAGITPKKVWLNETGVIYSRCNQLDEQGIKYFSTAEIKFFDYLNTQPIDYWIRYSYDNKCAWQGVGTHYNNQPLESYLEYFGE